MIHQYFRAIIFVYFQLIQNLFKFQHYVLKQILFYCIVYMVPQNIKNDLLILREIFGFKKDNFNKL